MDEFFFSFLTSAGIFFGGKYCTCYRMRQSALIIKLLYLSLVCTWYYAIKQREVVNRLWVHYDYHGRITRVVLQVFNEPFILLQPTQQTCRDRDRRSLYAVHLELLIVAVAEKRVLQNLISSANAYYLGKNIRTAYIIFLHRSRKSNDKHCYYWLICSMFLVRYHMLIQSLSLSKKICFKTGNCSRKILRQSSSDLTCWEAVADSRIWLSIWRYAGWSATWSAAKSTMRRNSSVSKE